MQRAPLPQTLYRWGIIETDFIAGALTTVGSMEVWLRHTSPTGQVLREGQKEDANGGKAATAKAA